MKTAYTNLQEFIAALEAAGELLRIQAPVSAHLEITQITDLASKSPGGGKALLFERVEGSDFPVLTNAFGSERRICMALGVPDLDTLAARLRRFIQLEPPKSLRDALRLLPMGLDLLQFFPRRVRRAPCQEVVLRGAEVDLSRLPVLTCWPQDAAPFVTLPVVITRSLTTGRRNAGMYRLQLFDRTTTGMHWHIHKDGSHYYQEYRKAGRRMPVAVAIGTDPATTYAATAPLPRGVDEMLLAGFIRRKPVPLVRCVTVDLEVPAEAEFILEGYVDPDELRLEGPFGDHTGYYSLVGDYPVFHVTAITHRRRPVYPATVVGRPPMEDCYLAKATERIFLPLLSAVLPEVRDYWLPWEGVFHNIAVLAIDKEYPGHARRIMSAIWGQGQMSFCKAVALVDSDVGLGRPGELFATILDGVDLASDLYVTEGVLDVLDHSAPDPLFGGKLGIDATRRLPEEKPRPQQTPPAPPPPEAIQSALAQVCERLGSFHAPGIGRRNRLLLVHLHKEGTVSGAQIAQKLLAHPDLGAFSLIALYDGEIDLRDSSLLLWKAFNNVDPKRDIFRREARVVIDATKKGPEDGHHRPWPDDIAMDPEVVGEGQEEGFGARDRVLAGGERMKFLNLSEEQVRQFAGETIFGRGQSCFKKGRVTTLDYDPDAEAIRARVSGSYGEYELEIGCVGNGIEASCDCPYEGHPCKHIVAALLAFLHDRKHYLRIAEMEKKDVSSLRGAVEALPRDALVELVMACVRKYPDFKRELTVRFLTGKKSTLASLLKEIDRAFPSVESRSYYPPRIAGELVNILKAVENASAPLKLDVQWAVADRILRELNEYGMNEESLELLVQDVLQRLTELLAQEDSLAGRKREILAGLMDYYTWGNSGMVDSLYETALELCSEDADYRIVIEKLEAQPKRSSYIRHLLAELYEAVGDREKQLAILEQNLEYGMDYWHLAQYWIGRGDGQKALEIVRTGIERGKGKKNELYKHLEQYHVRRNDYDRILEILERKIERGHLDFEAIRSDSAYQILKQHYDSRKDYRGLAALLELRLKAGRINLDLYQEAEKTLNAGDWPIFEKKLLGRLRGSARGKQQSPWSWMRARDEEILAEIYDYKGELDELFKVASGRHDLLVKYEARLLPEHPQEYAKAYRARIDQLIAQRGRENYRAAVVFLRAVRRIYTEFLKEGAEWERYLERLKDDNRTLRALQEELQKL